MPNATLAMPQPTACLCSRDVWAFDHCWWEWSDICGDSMESRIVNVRYSRLGQAPAVRSRVDQADDLDLFNGLNRWYQIISSWRFIIWSDITYSTRWITYRGDVLFSILPRFSDIAQPKSKFG
jgi:hypothetical protein